MLTTIKTDKPVAAYLASMPGGEYRPTGEFIYFSEDVHPPLPPKVRKLLIQHYGMLPPEGDEVECAHPMEKFAPVFDRRERITMFIAGCQNCGKSYFISQFLKTYKTIHPERPVYLVTGLSEKDAHFEGLEMWKVDLGTIPTLTLEDLRRISPDAPRTGSLVIFDDVDRITDDQVNKAVVKLISDILSNGRDHATQRGVADIDIIVTNHEVNDYGRTKRMLTECNYVVLFPSATVGRQMKLIIDKIGVGKGIEKQITHYKTSRSVIIHKTYPMYCVMEDKVMLLR